MAKLNVNPTRMELLKLRKRVTTAKRGHKLLKEKRDGLMKKFMAIIREAKEAREQIEVGLADAFKKFLFASASMRSDVLTEALVLPSQKISLTTDTENVMSVEIPIFDIKQEGDFLSYGLINTASGLDNSLQKFSDNLSQMVKLAQIEHSALLLAQEIEKTRRRVNALEYVLIPNLEETVKYIEMKLAEQERANVANVMRVKELISQE
ncbi:MAG: V-type ATP synthase subunit D [bacterium]